MATISKAHERPSAWSLRGDAWLGLFLLAASCKQPVPETKPVELPPPTREEAAALAKPVSLEINGYNYTDLAIDTFEVNGQGGGDLAVSSTTSGGGKGACCVGLSPGTKFPVELTIRWTRDRKRWCEKAVQLAGVATANPQHLGVHFFPDGHIEAEVTEGYPDLKLKLDRVDVGRRKAAGNSVQDEQSARCRDGDDP
ncbi:DUF3304 domain-containing protein [Corallococcus carmarthensis]|uniref:DUF3304 domain-containing protein n=1 Tax=Corallococcus carmarthensis TaxID=2316728 RepID=A0A3A8JKZ2_9BACT|nr:DUF3304 domain-containing protein [Corallococcus carmarthensis]RKG96035.1 DUF3304 domain-containing protein [Corallococcus carmarthensis]